MIWDWQCFPQEAVDGGLEIGDAFEDAAFEPLSCQLGEEAPDRDAIRPLKNIPQARCGGRSGPGSRSGCSNGDQDQAGLEAAPALLSHRAGVPERVLLPHSRRSVSRWIPLGRVASSHLRASAC